MKALRLGGIAVDGFVALFTGFVTLISASAMVDKTAHWLAHDVYIPLAVAQGLMLLGRRRFPVAVLAGTTAVGVFMIVASFPSGTASIGVYFAAYAVAVYYRSGDEGARLAATLRNVAVMLVAALAIGVASQAPHARDRAQLSGLLSDGGFVAAFWLLGYAVRTRRAYIEELKARAARLEAEEGERAARAVVDERLRIARELHDVIGHSISLITIQAEAANRSVRTNPDGVPEFLTRISDASRQALTEMRHVLAVLRPGAEAELSPSPGLADLGELVARLNAEGVRTRLDAEPMALPPGLALTVYRIVQESLTNVLKHAGPGARAAVTVARSEDSVRVSVHDDGSGPTGPASSAAHGIVGMRERVAAYDGTLRTGPRADGGFEVEALIPLHVSLRREAS